MCLFNVVLCAMLGLLSKKINVLYMVINFYFSLCHQYHSCCCIVNCIFKIYVEKYIHFSNLNIYNPFRLFFHYFKTWVQFTSPRSQDQWIHCFFTSPCSLQIMNSLKIQWNHLAYMDTFCCSAYDWRLPFSPYCYSSLHFINSTLLDLYFLCWIFDF
jgi:hypothetical protein